MILNLKSVKRYSVTRKKNSDVELTCGYCHNKFKVRYNKRHQKNCSRSCNIKYRHEHEGFGTKGGKASAIKQSQVRRSKNEIKLADLCENYFDNVMTNKAIFNGWDADIIIEDYKIAILWNGKWHYEKITKSHSVEQVQTRDNIKISEIIKSGYIPYVIKDMGKEDENFVNKQFEVLLEYINELTS